jgi:hypothetical protein
VLPPIVLTQLGIIVGLGILLDTFLVRTVVILALFTIIGPQVWWPASWTPTRRGRVRPARPPPVPGAVVQVDHTGPDQRQHADEMNTPRRKGERDPHDRSPSSRRATATT